MAASISLYILWHILWFLWKPQKKSWYRVLAGAACGLLVVTVAICLVKADLVYRPLIFRFILVAIVFLAIQFALKAQQNIARLRLEKEQIQTQQYLAQLKALRAKVDPHFLFNSLNTLRSMVRQKHDNSEEFVISLSDFYRQTLKHEENATLPLKEELDVLQSYLFVMKSRNESAMDLKLAIDPASYTAHLPSLALQVVVENCFKHNSMTSKQPLQIVITNTEDGYIEVENNLQPKISPPAVSGLGLDLLRKRYALMNIQDGLLIEKTSDHFRVKLKLIKR